MIIIDFDDTLCNTGLLWETVAKKLEKNYQLSSWLFFELRAKILPTPTTLYRLKDHLTEIARSTDISLEKLKGMRKDILFYLKTETSKFLFDDTEEFLKKYQPNLILLTLGQKYLQSRKIEGAKISSYFKEIIITHRAKVKDIEEKIVKSFPGQDLVFIDDKPDEINLVEKKLPWVHTIRMMRPQGRFTRLDSTLANLEAKDLREAATYIDKFWPDGKI